LFFDNSAGQIETVFDPSVGGQTFITDVNYNQHGQITDIHYANGVVTTYTYHPQNLRLSHIVTSHTSQGGLQDLSYTYDKAGNILTITDAVNTASQSFAYDELNRLTAVAWPTCPAGYISSGQATAGPGASCMKTYQYNAVGNIMQKDGLTYTYGQNGAGPHAVTSLSDGTTFSYDANGNMTDKWDGPSGDHWEYLP
jgi:YD repeat-containing protein